MPRKKKSSRRSYSRRDSSDYDDSSYSSYSSRSDSRDRYSREDSQGRYEDSRDRRRDRDRHHSVNSRHARDGSRARDDRYYREGSRARDYSPRRRDDHHSPRRRDDQRSPRRHRSNRDDRERSYHRDDSYMDGDEDRRGSSGSRRSSIEKVSRRRSSSQRYDSDEDYDRNERSRGSRRRPSIEKPTRRSSSQRHDSDEDYDRNERSRARNEERKARKGRRREKSSRKLVPETNLQVQQRRNNNHFPLGKLAQLPIGDNIKLKKMLEEQGLGIVDMSSDGNCLFRSLSDQLYNDQGHHHDEVRSDICDFMAENEAQFSMFLAFEGNGKKGSRDAKDYESYIADTRRDGVWGGNLELVAAARMYRRNIVVYNSTLSHITIDCDCEETSGPDMLLSFQSGDHYNSVRAIPSNKKSSRGKSIRKLVRSASGGSSRRSLGDTATTTASTVSVAPVANDIGLQDTNIVVATVVGIDDEPIRKNAQCPCGSGKRYKKCCGARLKEEKKEERRKKDRRSPSRPRDNDGTESAVSGFKVLAI